MVLSLRETGPKGFLQTRSRSAEKPHRRLRQSQRINALPNGDVWNACETEHILPIDFQEPRDSRSKGTSRHCESEDRPALYDAEGAGHFVVVAAQAIRHISLSSFES